MPGEPDDDRVTTMIDAEVEKSGGINSNNDNNNDN